MIIIRLVRLGAKKKPFYRIVAVDTRKKMTSNPLAVLGYWQPDKELKKIDKSAFKKWVDMGAKVSKAVNALINQ